MSGLGTVRRVAGFGLNSGDAAGLAEFYTSALGARRIVNEQRGGALPICTMVQSRIQSLTLQLGEELIDIWQFATPGRPCPRPFPPGDTGFQHFALVVSDMDAAVSQLAHVPGWTPISQGGPQHLPQRSGGVIAFKFQDPEGHPLELLAFPSHAIPPHWRARWNSGIFLGIDHSAISVRDTAASVAFYAAMGFTTTAQTLNHGPQQASLDGVPDPRVEVTALSAAAPDPHVELLCYQTALHPARAPLAAHDLAASRLVLDANAGTPRLIVDPDGHHLLLM